jgi:hypothetical protein
MEVSVVNQLLAGILSANIEDISGECFFLYVRQ